jgi:hypothetical protein
MEIIFVVLHSYCCATYSRKKHKLFCAVYITKKLYRIRMWSEAKENNKHIVSRIKYLFFDTCLYNWASFNIQWIYSRVVSLNKNFQTWGILEEAQYIQEQISSDIKNAQRQHARAIIYRFRSTICSIFFWSNKFLCCVRFGYFNWI